MVLTFLVAGSASRFGGGTDILGLAVVQRRFDAVERRDAQCVELFVLSLKRMIPVLAVEQGATQGMPGRTSRDSTIAGSRLRSIPAAKPYVSMFSNGQLLPGKPPPALLTRNDGAPRSASVAVTSRANASTSATFARQAVGGFIDALPKPTGQKPVAPTKVLKLRN